MLSDAQVESYRELGYVVADFNLPESVLDDLRADQKRLISRHSEFRDICPNLLAHDLLLDLNEHLMNSVLIHISLSI